MMNEFNQRVGWGGWHVYAKPRRAILVIAVVMRQSREFNAGAGLPVAKQPRLMIACATKLSAVCPPTLRYAEARRGNGSSHESIVELRIGNEDFRFAFFSRKSHNMGTDNV